MRPSPPGPPPLPARILHITQPTDGGVARVVTDLVRAQLAEGLHVTVACPDGGGEFARTLRTLGAGVRPWRAARAPGPALPAEALRIARTVAAVRPDLVHAHSAKAGLAGRLAVRGRIPTVFQPHAWSFEAVGGVTAALARAWERWAARWADRVVCVSGAERLTGERAGVRARWRVIANGVDTERFRPAAGTVRDVRAVRAGIPLLAGVPAEAPLVVCVGRLCPQKGQDVLLAAWGAVVRRVPGARLVLVGDGPDAVRLRDLAGADGGVLFAGAAADVVPWYRAADLVVLPSRWEGMALAPLEAMACGRPVVLTDVDGARESLPPGRAPVPAGDPAALARALTRLLLDPPLRASLGHEGRRHVLTAHDVRHTAAAVTEVYRELLGAALPGATGARHVPPGAVTARRAPSCTPHEPSRGPGGRGLVPAGPVPGGGSTERRESDHP